MLTRVPASVHRLTARPWRRCVCSTARGYTRSKAGSGQADACTWVRSPAGGRDRLHSPEGARSVTIVAALGPLTGSSRTARLRARPERVEQQRRVWEAKRVATVYVPPQKGWDCSHSVGPACSMDRVRSVLTVDKWQRRYRITLLKEIVHLQHGWFELI